MAGAEANDVLRSCVQCGFWATCPTCQLTGDELDGPRSWIWLMKEMRERDAAGAQTQLHLDRCLACETTCPSGGQVHTPIPARRGSMTAAAVPSPST